MTNPLVFHETADARFPGRVFLWTNYNGKIYGASFVDRRAKAEKAIRDAIATAGSR